MNKLKFFDRPQLLIAIIGVASLALTVIIYLAMFITAQIVYNEQGIVETMIYDKTLQNLYTAFNGVHLLMVTWFIARAITFKLRQKEADLD